MRHLQQPYTLLLLQTVFPDFNRQSQLLPLTQTFLSTTLFVLSSIGLHNQQTSSEGTVVCSRSCGITTDHQRGSFLLCVMG